MLYAEYEQWLHAQHPLIVLEPSCQEIGPLHNPTREPDRPPWNMDWGVIFSDGMYAVLSERWWIRPSKLGGRGYRKHFSFHYGPTNPLRDAEGIPVRESVNYPPVIRIDDDQWGPHIHFQGEDHIPQNRVQGMRISDIDPFDFMRAVLDHRAKGIGFDKILKFSVVP